jgi:hypothetical protein
MLARQLSDFNKYYHSAFSALFYYIFNMSGREQQQHSYPLSALFILAACQIILRHAPYYLL